MHVFHMYLTWDMCVLLMNEVFSVVGDTSSPWNSWSRADVSKIHAAEWNVDRMLSEGLAFFFGCHDDCYSRNGRSDGQVRVTFIWSWIV